MKVVTLKSEGSECEGCCVTGYSPVLLIWYANARFIQSSKYTHTVYRVHTSTFTHQSLSPEFQFCHFALVRLAQVFGSKQPSITQFADWRIPGLRGALVARKEFANTKPLGQHFSVFQPETCTFLVERALPAHVFWMCVFFFVIMSLDVLYSDTF